MHGANNALCFLKGSSSMGFMETTVNIPKQQSPEHLARYIVDLLLEHGNETMFLAIDAPLSFPKAFVSQITHLDRIGAISSQTQISNPLAYRRCETYLYEATGKRPLSSSFDQLTSLVFLVLRCFELLKEEKGLHLHRIPFEGHSIEKGINAFECYPALLKPLKKPLKSGHEKKIAFDNYVTNSGLSLGRSHTMDAQYSALFAVYEHLLNPAPFSVHDNYDGKLQEEGWIYGPY